MEFRLLGALEVVDDGSVVDVGYPKMRALLTTLLLRANTVVAADRLIDDLWGETPPATATGTLQTYVARLRRALEPSARTGEHQRIVSRRPGYLIRVEPHELDISRFDELVADGRRAMASGQWLAAAEALRVALALWRGPAMGEQADEPFAHPEAVRLEEARVAAVEDRVAADLALGAHTELVGELEALVTEHPLREKLRGQLMVALYRSGRQAEALRAYEGFRRLLGEELGIAPSAELRRLEEAILLQNGALDWPGAPPSVSRSGRPAERSPEAAGDVRPPTIPLQLTSYVGPEHPRTVQKLLATTRLLTLTGAGGIGKTRLAVEVAAAVAGDYEGVTVVELAPVGDPSLVPRQVLTALGGNELPGGTVTRALVDHVAGRRLLLVLDNCEHLLEASAQVVHELLGACPNLRVLVTSRERLRVPAETVWRVPALPVPPSPADGLPPPHELADYESVRLFLDRARSLVPELELSEHNAMAVAEICRRLDGIPLALELAAARTSALSLEELAERLDDRFRLLASGSRTAPTRHRTLRAAVDWTYEALTRTEKRVFDRISVFAGGFDLEAVETVAAGEGVEAADVFEAVTGLIDKSLVLREQHGAASRYRVLETLRQYAAEKLAGAGEEAAVRGRLVDWALSVAERASAEAQPSAAWNERLALDLDNFRAALRWAVSHPNDSDALRLSLTLSGFWYLRALYSEGREWLDEALAVTPEGYTDLRARGLHDAAGFALAQADYPAARLLERQSLALCEHAGDLPGTERALRRLGVLATRQDRYEEAAHFGEASLSIARRLDDKATIAASLSSLSGATQATGDLHRALRQREEALGLYRQLGDELRIGSSLVDLAQLALITGDYDTADIQGREAERIARRLGATGLLTNALFTRGASATLSGDLRMARELLETCAALDEGSDDRHGSAWSRQWLADVATAEGDLVSGRRGHEEVLAVAGELDDRYMAACSLRGLARVECAAGDARAAADHCLRAVRITDEIGDKPGLAAGLEILAAIAARDGDGERAARLLGAAETLRSEVSSPVPRCRREEYGETVAFARAAVGDHAFERARALGRRMGRAQRLAAAVEGTDQRGPDRDARLATGSRQRG